MKNSLLIPLLFFVLSCHAQEFEKIIVSKTDADELYINDGDATALFYYKFVPKDKTKGVLVIFPSGGEVIENTLKQITLHEKAVEKGMMVLVPSINWGTDDRLAEIAFLDIIFKQVVEKHQVSKDNFVFCGLSNGGMVSLSYAIRAVRDASTYIVPKGIIGLDPPLDFARFYAYCEREIKRNYTPAGVAEAKYMLNNYNTLYGGSPKEFPQKYIDASPFSYGAAHGGNAKYLTDIGVLMLSDLNLDYLLNQRKRDLNDWNGTDIVAFVNQLKINGNKNAEVIISQNKGVRLDGTKHPHSWSIMDSEFCVNWILELVTD